MMGLINEGCVPFLYAEGGYNTCLEIIKNDLPKGKNLWGFDQSDMAKAKEMIGGVACIADNVPSSLLSVGTLKEVKKYVKKLI
ncbi:MAG: hypothetical protein QXW80_02955 [Candidatus Micrarchaeia archaeon]